MRGKIIQALRASRALTARIFWREDHQPNLVVLTASLVKPVAALLYGHWRDGLCWRRALLGAGQRHQVVSTVIHYD